MSGYDFEDAGSFGSDYDAEQWAKRNGIDLRDIRTSQDGDSIRLEVRRDARDGRDIQHGDHSYGRRTGW